MSKQQRKVPYVAMIDLPVTAMDLSLLQWALQMDIEVNEGQLNEKKALLKRIKQSERELGQEMRTTKRSRKGNVVKIDPRAEAADVLDKPAS